MANLSATSLNTSGDPHNGSLSTTYGCHWPADQMYDVTTENTPTLWVEIIFYPVLLFLCTVGNTLSIIVLSREVTKSTTNVYLICLAVSDLCVVWLALTLYIPDVNRSVLDSETYFQNTLNFRGIQVWWQETCVQFSDWTLIVFSLERLIAIARPLEYRNRLTVRRAIMIEMFVLLLAAVSALENLVMWYYVLAHDDGVSSKAKLATPGLLQWEAIQNQAEVGITIAKWIILTILNVILIMVMAKHKLIRRSVLRFSSGSDREASEKLQRNSSIVLISCVALYFFTQFPNVIYKILDVASRPPYCTYQLTFAHKNIARPFVYMSVLTNYSVNFLLYCLVWKKFRDQVRYLANRTMEISGLSSPSTTLSTATNTPGGVGDSNAIGKRSLENPDGVQLTIAPLLALGHSKLVKKLNGNSRL